jgi:uncharacterized membrane protein YbhN (UPF0104 family)
VRQLGTPISINDGLRIGLVAQIGKYLPGNIAHYGGRGALAMNFGIPLKFSGISTAIELASALSAMMLVATIGLLVDSRPIAWLPETSTSAVTLVGVVLAGLVLAWVWLARRGTHLGLLVGPTLCLVVSFCLVGLSIYALARALGHADLPVAIAISTFALAWGAGFVVPGAPAGLGIREATLLALLSPLVGAGPAVGIAIIHRLITAVIDAIAALIGYAWLASGRVARE